MTATERAKRSDSLYYETVSVNRRVLCDMVANREADLEDARAENAKLRDGANAMRQLYEDELKHALAENAKLRELVRDLWKACPADGYYCIYHCEHYDKESESHCKLEDRMHELGVDACPNCGAKVVEPTKNDVDVEVEQ